MLQMSTLFGRRAARFHHAVWLALESVWLMIFWSIVNKAIPILAILVFIPTFATLIGPIVTVLLLIAAHLAITAPIIFFIGPILISVHYKFLAPVTDIVLDIPRRFVQAIKDGPRNLRAEGFIVYWPTADETFLALHTAFRFKNKRGSRARTFMLRYIFCLLARIERNKAAFASKRLSVIRYKAPKFAFDLGFKEEREEEEERRDADIEEINTFTKGENDSNTTNSSNTDIIIQFSDGDSSSVSTTTTDYCPTPRCESELEYGSVEIDNYATDFITVVKGNKLSAAMGEDDKGIKSKGKHYAKNKKRNMRIKARKREGKEVKVEGKE